MSKHCFSTWSAVALGLVMSIASVCQGQVTTATLTGEITEMTGGVLPGAAVLATNQNTGVVSKTITNSEGLYRISGLEPGVYKVNISKDGFKSVLKTDIQLHVEEVAALSFILGVGSVNETVTVESGAPLVDTQTTSLGDTIEGRAVEDTPLNGRNVMNLVALVPGVVSEGTSSGNPASNQGSNNTQTYGFGNYQISGGLAGWNATFIDGANVNADASPRVSIIPTQDSIGEFHVDTNAPSAQFGNFAGGVISFSTKSGGNKFHGTAYEYFRNTVLDANTFFNGRLGAPVPVLHQNQFGAAIGGPIVRNKTFFFFSWEQTRLLTAAAQSFRVPTAAEINGDFTSTFGTTTDSIKDYGNLVGGVPQKPELCPGGGINKICPQHLSPTVQQMFKIQYWTPVETNPVKLALLQSQGYNTQFIGKQANNEIQYVTRIDHSISEKQKLFGRYTYWNVFIPLPSIGKMPALPTQPTGFTSQQYVAGDNYSISPTLNADARLAYTRWNFLQQNNGNGAFDLDQFGPGWATLSSQLAFKAPPVLAQNNYPNEPYSINLYQHNQYNNYAISLSLTKVLGHHTIIFGGEARRAETYDFAVTNPGGTFNFSAASTGVPSVAGAQAAGIAQLVTGVSNNTGSSSLTVRINPDNYNYYQGYYVNDTFQVRSRLTLNLGIRWELPGAWYEKHDHNSVLLPNVPNPLGSFSNPVPGGSGTLIGVIAEVNGPLYSSRAQSQIHTHLFEPRVGINYAFNPTTVVHAGFGIAHPCITCGSVTPNNPDSSPLNAATTNNPLGFSSIDTPYPGGLLQPLKRGTQLMAPHSVFPQTLIGAAVTGEEPVQTYPYVGQWNLGLQQSLGSSTAFLLAYSGSRGLHLGGYNRNLDQLPDQYDALGATLLTKVANPFFGVAQPSGSVGAATANYGQFLVPFPQFSGVISTGKQYGESYYNALNATLKKRFGQGATVNLSYTWAHFISNVESYGSSYDATGLPLPQDYTNPHADLSNDSADIPQTVTLNYILDLPFGQGKPFLSHSGRRVDWLVSGWTFSGISIFQSGFPLSFSVQGGNALSTNFYAGQIRPNVVLGQSKTVNADRYDRINQWFNTAAFASPGSYAFGNESRVDSELRADALRDWDMSLSKNTKIAEGIQLQFRAEYFNVFNHPQYGAPSTVLGNANFGKITANTGSGSTNGPQPRIGQLSLRLNF